MKQLVESFINNGGMVKYCATTLCVLAFKTTFSLVRVNHDSLSDLALETWIQSYPSVLDELSQIILSFVIIRSSFRCFTIVAWHVRGYY